MQTPALLYGTAWKESDTRRLVELALATGFRGIDTANQRKHYDEASVGQALVAAWNKGALTRDDIFLQTKFTYLSGQDARLPYDANAPVSKQVEQSFQSSLKHLGVSFIDSYVLHGPSSRGEWSATDREAWRAMESLHQEKKARALGVSNITLPQLEELCATSRVRPAFVQNRCYARLGWDFAVRHFCEEHGIVYQGFSLLTANPHVVRGAPVASVAKKYGKTPEQVVFRYALEMKMLPLTGTTQEVHMRQDLDAVNFELDEADHAALEDTAFA